MSNRRQELSQLFSEMNRETAPKLSAPAAPVPFGCPADTSTRDELRAHTCVDGLAAPGPAHPGAASQPIEWPIDWGQMRDTLARLHDALAGVQAAIEALDPTPGGLAAAVTDLDAYRR